MSNLIKTGRTFKKGQKFELVDLDTNEKSIGMLCLVNVDIQAKTAQAVIIVVESPTNDDIGNRWMAPIEVPLTNPFSVTEYHIEKLLGPDSYFNVRPI